jgi:hypothetical protein
MTAMKELGKAMTERGMHCSYENKERVRPKAEVE